MIDWRLYPNFSEEEFRCRCGCGQALMESDFLACLQVVRTRCGFPFVITSGYRCKDHPAEKRKGSGQTTGEHVLGKAADINVFDDEARTLLGEATQTASHLFPRIGLKQRGERWSRFIHLGTATDKDGLPSPTVWTY